MVAEVFNTIDNASLADRVEARLIELLQQKKLKVGDSIPKEIDLATSLGVSRTVIREALLRLRMMGLIDSKKKRGAIITSPDIFGTLSKSMNPHVLSDDTLKEVFELRLVLEVGMADLLFRNITEKDIEELKQIVKDEPVAAKNRLFDKNYEISFHSKLYEITGNETLKKFQTLLLPIFDYVHKSALVKKNETSGKFVSHKQLVAILEKRDPQAFRDAMRAHLNSHFERINQ